MSQSDVQQHRQCRRIHPASCGEAFTEVVSLSRLQVLAFLLPDTCSLFPHLDALACFHSSVRLRWARTRCKMPSPTRSARTHTHPARSPARRAHHARRSAQITRFAAGPARCAQRTTTRPARPDVWPTIPGLAGQASATCAARNAQAGSEARTAALWGALLRLRACTSRLATGR